MSQEWGDIFDSVEDLFVVLDNENKIEKVNQSFLDYLEFSEDEVLKKYCKKALGSNCFKTLPEADKCLVEKCKNSKKLEESEYYLPDLDRYVLAKAYPITKNDEKIKKIVVQVIDISEWKETEEREEFLHSLLRHDIRNKIQIARGYNELILSEEKLLEKNGKEFIRKSDKALKRGIELIEKIRKLRNIEEEKIGDINPNLIISKVISQYLAQAQAKGINIEFEKCDFKVKAGPLLDELFSNLIENSIKHSSCNKIRITSETENNKCKIIVEDDGKEIPEEYQDKVFDKGFRRGKESGSGLGLYMVKEISKKYGGSVEVKDSELGGTRFDVHLQKSNSQVGENS